MRLLVKSLLVTTLQVAYLSNMAFAQTVALEKADKQYELFAYAAAAKSYESFLEVNEDTQGVMSRLANCYRHLNELERAAEWYARAIQMKTDANVYLHYGQVLMMLEQYDKATEMFKKYAASNESHQKVGDHFIGKSAFAKRHETPAPYELSLAKFNTASSDFGAILYQNKAVFSSTRTDLKRKVEGNKKDWTGAANNQWFSSDFNNEKSTFFKTDLKNVYNDSYASFSKDGKMVAFTRNNFGDGERIASKSGLEMSIYTAIVLPNGDWSDVRAFQHNLSATGFPSLSEDGNTMYFASDRPNGYGGFDIYMSFKKGNQWSEPQNLGNTVNSMGDEITPFVQGGQLFFASDWHHGFGGYDMFKTEPLKGFWAEPINVGKGLNSSGDDYAYFFDVSARKGFVTSNRQGGKGKEDVYLLSLNVNSAYIAFYDEETKQPVNVYGKEIDVLQGEVSALKIGKGDFIYEFNNNQALVLRVKKVGYKVDSFRILPIEAQGRTVELALNRIQMDVPTEMGTNSYTGMVKDGQTGAPLAGVTVTSMNQSDKKSQTTKSDKNGRFSFHLLKNVSYILTFSKENYAIAHKLLKSVDGKERNLGEIRMEIGGDTKTTLAVTTAPIKDSPQETPKLAISNNTTTPTAPQMTAKGQGFSVQLSVIASTQMVDLSPYDALKSFGKVYAVPEDGKTKIRLGVFKHRADAETASKKAAEKGYKGTFVLDEVNAEAIRKNTVAAKSGEKESKSDAEIAVTKPNPSKIADKSYKVRIAAFKNPKLFDETHVKDLGKVEQIREGEVTIFVFNGIKSLDAARELRGKVRTAGYKDARIVIYEHDTFRFVE
jgi:tetratricopeptide (TPR) repeat protein